MPAFRLLLLLIALLSAGCAPVRRPAAPAGEPGAGGPREPVSRVAGVRAEQDLDGPPEDGGRPPMPPVEELEEVPNVRVEAVARGLRVPWAIAFARDGRMFVTERPGRIRVLRPNGRGGYGPPAPYLDLNAVVSRGEGGLMGLALHPRFGRPRHLYVMYTVRKRGTAVNRISRFTDAGRTARREKVLVDDIPAAQFHDGGALAFGPDGMLYAGTGDAGNPGKSQDLGSLSGKILRLTPEGTVPTDNPFSGSFVWAYGFRNVTGLAWHPRTGELWAANHGPSGEFGGMLARDSVYVVRKGGNHGWPVVVGTTERPGIESPVLYYPEDAIPPGGSLFYTGTLLPQLTGSYFLATLGSAHLQRVVVEGDRGIAFVQVWWPERYGRLRALAQGLDGAIYFTTSNQDGRAFRSYPGSDFIYRILPAR